MSNENNMDELSQLQEWYAAECNGDWEHQYGIQIGTLDNPGWLVDIDLSETSLETRPFDGVVIDRNDEDWVRCKVEKAVFRARGGAKNLREMLQIFLAWSRCD